MRALAIGLAVAAILFLVSGGRLLFIPLLFVPLGLFGLRRPRRYPANAGTRRFDVGNRPG